MEQVCEPIPMGDIERQPGLINEILSRIAPFSTAIIYREQLIGSGTFVRKGNRFGILTAHHVAQNPESNRLRLNFDEAAPIGLLLVSFPHRFEIPANHCSLVEIGIPPKVGLPPDLAIIEIPQPYEGQILARKSAFDISFRPDERIGNAMNGLGCMVFAGAPAERIVEPRNDGAHFVMEVGIHGYCAITSRQGELWEVNAFDYMNLGVDYENAQPNLTSFGGMSGGGVWKVIFERKGSMLSIVDVVLSGIGFVQSDIAKGKRTILCHGPKSIYKAVSDHL